MAVRRVRARHRRRLPRARHAGRVRQRLALQRDRGAGHPPDADDRHGRARRAGRADLHERVQERGRRRRARRRAPGRGRRLRVPRRGARQGGGPAARARPRAGEGGAGDGAARDPRGAPLVGARLLRRRPRRRARRVLHDGTTSRPASADAVDRRGGARAVRRRGRTSSSSARTRAGSSSRCPTANAPAARRRSRRSAARRSSGSARWAATGSRSRARCRCRSRSSRARGATGSRACSGATWGTPRLRWCRASRACEDATGSRSERLRSALQRLRVGVRATTPGRVPGSGFRSVTGSARGVGLDPRGDPRVGSSV